MAHRDLRDQALEQHEGIEWKSKLTFSEIYNPRIFLLAS